MAEYCLPVSFDYNGRKHIASMGPFEHSTEREFALAVNRKAIGHQLKSQGVDPLDMEAAEELLSQASRIIEHLQCEQQSPKTKWRLWPW